MKRKLPEISLERTAIKQEDVNIPSSNDIQKYSNSMKRFLEEFKKDAEHKLQEHKLQEHKLQEHKLKQHELEPDIYYSETSNIMTTISAARYAIGVINNITSSEARDRITGRNQLEIYKEVKYSKKGAKMLKRAFYLSSEELQQIELQKNQLYNDLKSYNPQMEVYKQQADELDQRQKKLDEQNQELTKKTA